VTTPTFFRHGLPILRNVPCLVTPDESNMVFRPPVQRPLGSPLTVLEQRYDAGQITDAEFEAQMHSIVRSG